MATARERAAKREKERERVRTQASRAGRERGGGEERGVQTARALRTHCHPKQPPKSSKNTKQNRKQREE